MAGEEHETQEQEKESTGNLLHNLVLFGRLLHELDLDVNPGRMLDLVQALEYIKIGRRWEFYYTARSLLVHNREDQPKFDEAFDLFWRKRGMGSAPHADQLQLKPPRRATVTSTPLDALKDQENGAANSDQDNGKLLIETTATYSNREVIRQKDFSDLSYEEEKAVKRFIADKTWDFGQRRTRRRRVGQGDQPDFRRGFRQNMRYGGELLEWPTRRPKMKPRPLIVIADISGSMERYSRLLIHFVYGICSVMEKPVEAFVFSTRLTRITRQLRYKSIERSLEEVSSVVHDWAGGTRIGDALKDFNYNWARRVLAPGAVVLLISDGWDRGDPELLKAEASRLQRSSYRFIWLNPLLGSPSYEPLTRGMQAALPSIDDFLPVHNLASLEDLATHLAQLMAGKQPIRFHQAKMSDSFSMRFRQ